MQNAFAEAILKWYAFNRRELPWRDIADPYRIWISEIILQQTRVSQGYDYYRRFIEAFPTVEALADAPQDDVMRLWQGLGYYSRARNLHAAARQVMEEHGGRFPTDYAGVRALKGVGDYTAAAICSFAYKLHVAVVDGNVYRVLSRYYGIDDPIDTTKGKRTFASLALDLLPADGQAAADYNQGLMDFGAMQCVPQSPECPTCPFAPTCQAFREGRVAELPVKTHKTQTTDRYLVYLCVRSPHGYWLHRRDGADIWRGLYEFPLLEFDGQTDSDAVMKHPFVSEYLSDAALHASWSIIHRDYRHVLTHRILHADAYLVTLDADSPAGPPESFIIVPDDKLGDFPMPRLVEKIAQDLESVKA